MTDDAIALRWDGVSKSYGEAKALDGFSLAVPKGSVFGLLGRNGTGKTTAIRILLGLLRPAAGRSEVLGEDSLSLSRSVRQRLGYLSEEPFPVDDLPMPYLLRYLSAFFDDWDEARVARLGERLRVVQDRPLSKMSLGERRKAELFATLAPDPEVLVLDDPWVGIDAASRREFLWTALDLAREQGKTILFTSHILTDVERVADRVAFLRDGAVHLQGELDEVKARAKRLVVEGVPDAVLDSLAVPGEVSRSRSNGTLVLTTTAFQAAVLDRIRASAPEARVEDLNLEEIFCEVAGREAAP